ncbi:uncharacterized protein B0I36DRAFT_364886 [Microdochium trichocladiopsis]|uniref:DUF7492 domain-containing protein n=1 Tax=Microdochium trichocladiopsis TaxID=1682393 RepID=A0A9P8Y3B4_9PEZI|nr:uncharacterized protein B0I36DRAFT_364886 [Microdochium trichocladiopsis]KAH7027719.1 hypothetical protein B0I36DRAFT_364886 [Microdochium trichocladiopsis]
MAYRAAKTIVALLAVAPLASAHSWVEFLKRINSDGSFSKSTGYPIPYIARGAPGYSDDAMLNKILDKTSNPSVCKQGNFDYSQDAPRLAAAAGDYIAMQYQENGHVTQPGITQRPFRGGNVYIYGTLKDVKSTGINDVLYSWNAQGTGGDKRGTLLATHFFDDGQCYQNLGGVEPDPKDKIYTQRHTKFGVDSIDCQSDFRLPSNLPDQGIYNVMWVWDWPLITSEHTNVTETYTSCAEIQLKPKKSNTSSKINFASNHNVTNAAIKSQVHTLIEAVTLGQGTNSPPAPTGAAPTTPTAGGPTSTGPATVTVTVTAEPVTTTVFHTVTVGNTQDPTLPLPGLPTQFLPPFPTENPILAPTNLPTEFLPGLPTDLPTVFPTSLPPASTPSSSSLSQPSTFQTSVRSSSSSSSSASSLPSTASAASSTSSTVTTDNALQSGLPTTTSSSFSSEIESTSSTVTTDDGPLPGFPTRTSSSISSATISDDGPVPGFPSATSKSQDVQSSSSSAEASSSSQQSSKAADSTTSSTATSHHSTEPTSDAAPRPTETTTSSPAVTPAPEPTSELTKPSSAPTTFVPVTSVEGFL